MLYYVYILQCADGSYYTGSTSDLSRRFTEHMSGVDHFAYTYSRRPLKLVWTEECMSKEQALSFERQVNGWSRAKKEALIQNDWDRVHQLVKEEREKRRK